MPDEPDYWYARFNVFRFMEPQRSKLRIYNEEREKAGKIAMKSVLSRWNEAAREWEWDKRVKAWDVCQRQLDAQTWHKKRKQWREKQWEIAQVLRSKAEQILTLPVITVTHTDNGQTTNFEPGKWTFRDVAVLLKVADELARAATGDEREYQGDRLDSIMVQDLSGASRLQIHVSA